MTTTTMKQQETIDKRVKNFLKGLGSGPNKVADNLTEMKIRAIIGDSNQCPVAKAVRKNFKGLKDVSVDGDSVEFVRGATDYRVELPAAVSKFVEKFDNGDYPKLATKDSLANVLV